LGGGAGMQRTRIEIAKQDIVKLFEDHQNHVFKRSQIEEILHKNRGSWRLTQSMTASDFLNFLLNKTKLKVIKLDFPSRAETRYVWGDVSAYQLALSLKQNSYLTHYTAMFFHDLTQQIPKTIYLNFEQPVKYNPGSTLEQKNIDWAFRQKARVSNNIASYGEQRICILNGRETGMLGVVNQYDEYGREIKITNIERTLIDIAVRPFYAGGIYEVLNAYRRAKGKFSINKMLAMLKQLNYVYPYHQAIGFYMTRAEVYKESFLKLFSKFKMEYDFYLTYQMKNIEYSKEWRLYYPKGF
jgi:predicted transcriptional regulator of viral defense system